MRWAPILAGILSIFVVLAVSQRLVAQDDRVAVRVDTIDGLSKTGTLAAVSAEAVSLFGDDSTPYMIALDQVLSIQRTNPPPSTPTGATVGLVGQSRLAIQAVTSDGKTVTARVRGGDDFSLPLNMLRWIRFRAPVAAVNAQWLGLLDRPRASDALVIRRPGDALDEVGGVVLSISDESVAFNLDGDTMQAPVSRLEGIVFATTGGSGRTGPAAPDPQASGTVLVDDVFGSRFIATSLAGTDDQAIELTLGDQAKYRLPLSSIAKMELTGSVEFLAALEPASARYTPLVNIGISSDLSRQWFSPEVRDGRDVVMRSASHVEYRLSDGFQSLVGSVDFDPEVSAGGRCLVKILLDGKPVWEQSLSVADASPRGFELPISGARRVRFEVSGENDGDLGDTIRLRQPRITK